MIEVVNENISKNSKFKVGDILEYSSLYGGSYTAVIKSIKDNRMIVDVSWTSEDTGRKVTQTETYTITKDPYGHDCIVVWEYNGEKGYVYPPSSSNEVEADSSEDGIRALAKEMWELDVTLTSYEEFAKFMRDNNDTPTREMYKIYKDTVDACQKEYLLNKSPNNNQNYSISIK